MTEHLSSAQLSSYPISEDEFRKEVITKGLTFYQDLENGNSLNFEKMQDPKRNQNENQKIFNFIEFHLQILENSSDFENCQNTLKKIHLRSNSFTYPKDSNHEFFRKEIVKNRKKLFEFLKFFIMEIANSKILRIYKDYYPKVFFFKKIN